MFEGFEKLYWKGEGAMYHKGEGAITRDGDSRGMAGEAAVLSPRTTTLEPKEEAAWQAREYAAYLALKRGEKVRYRMPGEKVGRPFFYKRLPASYKAIRAEPAEEALAILYETILAAMEEADDFVALVAEAHRLRFINTIENRLDNTPGITLPEGFFPAFAALSQGEEQQLDAVLAKLRLEYLQTLERIASSYATRIGMKTREALEIKALVLSRPTRPQVETRIEQEKDRLRTRINQRLDQLRQRALGITHYVWRSQDDARVRPAHAQNDDRIFSWSTPPSTGHPGDDFGCRCTAEPVLTTLTEPGFQPAGGPGLAAFYTVEAEAIFTALLATAIAASLSRQTPGEDSPDPMDVRRALQLAQEIAERIADDGGPDLLDLLRALEMVAEITNRIADDEEDEGESEGEEATPPLPDLTQPDQDPDEEDPDEDGEDAPPEGRTDLEWELGEHKTPEKWSNQMRNRQWTEDEITNTIKNGRRFNAPNKVNPNNNASRYQLGNRFVIRDEVTKQILQVSGDGFIPN